MGVVAPVCFWGGGGEGWRKARQQSKQADKGRGMTMMMMKKERRRFLKSRRMAS